MPEQLPGDPGLPPGVTEQTVSENGEGKPCETCNGEGEVSIFTFDGEFKKNIVCPDCNGNGQSTED